MYNYKFIGVGAAGNKGAIALIESGLATKENTLLLNTTMRDIPAGYRDIAKQIGSSFSGSGKERNLAYSLTVEEIEKGDMLYLDEFTDGSDVYAVIVIAAIGGGTGSGASIAIAECLSNEGIHVHLCGYVGFSTDIRELKNSLGWCKSLREEFGVELICNAKFLEQANNNTSIAEKLCNKELVERMKIYTGSVLRDSSQNIDDTELFKLNTTPGFTTIERIDIPSRIKNSAQFDELINRMADHTKSPDFDANSSRIGIVLNISEASYLNIDSRFNLIKERFGMNPDEVFIHVQYTEDYPEFIAVMAVGNEIPYDDIASMAKQIKAQQTERKQTVNKKKFFKTIEDLDDGDDIDGIASAAVGRKLRPAKSLFTKE